MPRNLRDDFRLYYQGTYICKDTPDGRAVLHVHDVGYTANGYTPAEITITGHAYVCNPEGRVTALGYVTWTADEIVPFHPHSGYYRLSNSTPVYVDFLVQNRTNRKGFEPSKMLINGRHGDISGEMVARLFANPNFNGKVFIDLCISRSKLLWRGEEIGSFHDGELTVMDEHQHMQDYIEKHINNFRSNRG